MYLYVCVCLYACASCERAAAFALCATKVERASRQAHKVRTCKLWATCVPGAKLITNNKYTHTLTQTCRDAQICRQTSSKAIWKKRAHSSRGKSQKSEHTSGKWPDWRRWSGRSSRRSTRSMGSSSRSLNCSRITAKSSCSHSANSGSIK